MANKQHGTRQKMVFRGGSQGPQTPPRDRKGGARKPSPPPAPGTAGPAGKGPRQPRKLIGSSDS